MLSETKVTPTVAPRQCVVSIEARNFATGFYVSTPAGIEHMKKIHAHCATCCDCTRMVADAVAATRNDIGSDRSGRKLPGESGGLLLGSSDSPMKSADG